MPNQSEKVPKAMAQTYTAVTTISDAFYPEHLSEQRLGQVQAGAGRAEDIPAPPGVDPAEPTREAHCDRVSGHG